MDRKITIVPMAREHTPAIAELEKICFSEPWSENALNEELTNPDAVFFTALVGDEIAGYGGMHTPWGDCYIDNIAVFPSFRKMGAGDAIVKALCEKAETLGEFISLEVRASNANAISLYEKNGFVKAGVRKNFYSDPREDGLILTKTFER